MSKASLLDQIFASKKYRSIHPQTVEYLANLVSDRYPEKELEHRIKELLHSAYGAYLSTKPDYKKLLKKVYQRFETGESIVQICDELLGIHSSTKERFVQLPDFYRGIWAEIGDFSSIYDIGCGFSPLAFNYMNLSERQSYIGVDIDSEQVEFISKVLELAKLGNIRTEFGEIFSYRIPQCDVAMMLKLVPLLANLYEFDVVSYIESLDCKFVVVSFPTQSIGGKSKGMERNYASWFVERFTKYKKKELHFNNELLYILDKR